MLCRLFRTTHSRTTCGRRVPAVPAIADAQHFLGTDTTGRDVVARLVYGFRIAMAFSLILLACNYLIGIRSVARWASGAARSIYLFQRLIEVWSNVPFLT